VTNDPSFCDLWGLHNTGQVGGTPGADIHAPEAWNITTGSSDVVVAGIDPGIDYTHSDLAANMFRNEADCNADGIDNDGNGFIDDCFGIDTVNHDSDPRDDHDHGTHTAGTIGAVGAQRRRRGWRQLACEADGVQVSGCQRIGIHGRRRELPRLRGAHEGPRREHRGDEQ
jgi:subtilisin family serine protease